MNIQRIFLLRQIVSSFSIFLILLPLPFFIRCILSSLCKLNYHFLTFMEIPIQWSFPSVQRAQSLFLLHERVSVFPLALRRGLGFCYHGNQGFVQVEMDKERGTEKGRVKDRQKRDGQAETGKQTDTERDRQADRKINRQLHKYMNRQRESIALG